MKISIIAPEKIQTKYSKDAIKEYNKRLGAFTKVDYKVTKEVPKNAYVIQIDPTGENISSEELAQKIDHLTIHGNSHIAFILYPESTYPADYTLSLTKMDLDADLLTVILFEQVYRAFTIIHNRTYHK
ncbi:23S rRNA (pseudouridine(1915)-N(3))-methyltransferase RlmH [Jeotgalibaca porci]|uniref:23S rRNA (pseudouridine(1915)-N(3))-methyltransferase RlmH n=1 Tax=Jeotgalibaca porci TaxID=1868793 RepID=UPI003F912184